MEIDKCSSSNKSERMLILAVLVSTVVTISALGPPKYVGDGKGRQIAKVNHTKKLLCQVEGDPFPFIEWKKDGESINELWENHKVLKDGSLRIKQIEVENAGRYVCKATNGFGSIRVNYTLIVVDEEKDVVSVDGTQVYAKSHEEDLTKEGASPRFTNPEKMKRQKITRPVNSSLRLRCKATGNPRPQITWMKDNHELYQHDGGRKSSWILRLPDLQQTDSGHYTCVVRNRLGSINFTYHIEVIDKIMAKPELLAPHPLNTTVKIGESAQLQCRINSEMEPHIQWLKRVDDPKFMSNNSIKLKGQPFIILKTSEIGSGSDGTYLNKFVIHHVTEADGGMYICLAANTMGFSWRSAHLIVQSNHPQNQYAYTIDRSNLNIPLVVGVPGGILLVVIIIAFLFFQRRRRAQYHQGAVVNGPHFNRVPTQDPEPYLGAAHTNDVKTNIHVNPIHGPQHKNLYAGVPSPHLIVSSREMLSKNSQSIDFYTDISSVSQSHHNPHHHMQQYSYNGP
ncbi:fibroblast growth factor receptor-like 1 [Saccostrea echinata]|uniref:fibroblast growth factor receptor-like 1 n=1 Tax=Saccostrea echinata TaxID=191078 RepID=UPI002A817AF6|nr:fibroblast growth factor receptor-like 1 [Saccostrea echinata]